MTGTEANRLPTSRVMPIVLSLLVAIFAFQLNASMLSPALATMEKELAATTAEIGLTQTAFFTAAALFSLFLPRWGDLIGRRKVLVGMLVITAIGCAISALAPSVTVKVTLYEPCWSGVPEMVVPEKVRPGGSEPPTRRSWTLPSPPVVAMSCAKASCSSSETIALPPYLTTTIWSRNFFSHGNDSMSTCAFADACAWSSAGATTSCRGRTVRTC